MKTLREKVENILLEAWREISDFKPDGREFPNGDKISEYADQILSLFESYQAEQVKAIEKMWDKDAEPMESSATNPVISKIINILKKHEKNKNNF